MLCGRFWIDIGLVPVTSETRGQRVQRGAEGAHRGREYPRKQQSTNANRHFVKDVVTKNFVRRFRQIRIVMGLIKNPKQQSDAEKSERDRNIGQTGHDD